MATNNNTNKKKEEEVQGAGTAVTTTTNTQANTNTASGTTSTDASGNTDTASATPANTQSSAGTQTATTNANSTTASTDANAQASTTQANTNTASTDAEQENGNYPINLEQTRREKLTSNVYTPAVKSQKQVLAGMSPEEYQEALTNIYNQWDDDKLKTFLGELQKPQRPERELKDERVKQKMSVLLDSLRLLSDMGAATIGGNVYKRNNQDVAKSKARENALLDAYRKSLDNYYELRSDNIKEFGKNRAEAFKNLNEAVKNYKKENSITYENLKTQTLTQDTYDPATGRSSGGGRSSGSGSGSGDDGWNVYLPNGNGNVTQIHIPKANINPLLGAISYAANNSGRRDGFNIIYDRVMKKYNVTNLLNQWNLPSTRSQVQSAFAELINYGLPDDVYNAIRTYYIDANGRNPDFEYEEFRYAPDRDNDGNVKQIRSGTSLTGFRVMNLDETNTYDINKAERGTDAGYKKRFRIYRKNPATNSWVRIEDNRGDLYNLSDTYNILLDAHKDFNRNNGANGLGKAEDYYVVLVQDNAVVAIPDRYNRIYEDNF